MTETVVAATSPAENDIDGSGDVMFSRVDPKESSSKSRFASLPVVERWLEICQQATGDNNTNDNSPQPVIKLSMDEFPDKSLFTIQRSYAAISIPAKMTSKLRMELKLLLLQKPKTKNVYQDPLHPQHRRLLILKDPSSDEEGSNGDNAKTGNEQDVKNFFLNDPVFTNILGKCSATDDDTNNVRWYENPNDGTCLYTIQQTYNEMSADDIFQQLFRGGNDDDIGKQLIPPTFEIVGQIAHLNLRKEHLPFQYWIGFVLLEKNQPSIRTVVTKIGSIGETKYRTFPMEVIAGYGFAPADQENASSVHDWSITTTKEEGCTFQLDFRTVYWNSRLSGEHKRLVQLIQNDAINRMDQNKEAHSSENKDDNVPRIVVADLMAGVGPFAIPLTCDDNYTTGGKQPAKTRPKRKKMEENQHEGRNIIVHANDLNPESYKYLKTNAKLNRCDMNRLFCYNLDAREFVTKLQDDIIVTQQQNNNNATPGNVCTNIDHVIMNLPASAPEFLDAFRGWKLTKLPRIHVHCFAPKPLYLRLQQQQNEQNISTLSEPMTDHDDDMKQAAGTSSLPLPSCTLEETYQVALDRCSKALGCRIDWKDQNVDVHLVRDVSPGKNMLCVSFTLPDAARHLSPATVTSSNNNEGNGQMNSKLLREETDDCSDRPAGRTFGEDTNMNDQPDTKRAKLNS